MKIMTDIRCGVFAISLGLALAACGGAPTIGSSGGGEQTVDTSVSGSADSSASANDAAGSHDVANTAAMREPVQFMARDHHMAQEQNTGNSPAPEHTVRGSLEATLPLHFAHTLEVLNLPPPMLEEAQQANTTPDK